MPTCWECGNETRATMPATLHLKDGAPRQFPLCPACYEAHYLPLLTEDAGDTPPAPEADREDAARPRPRQRVGRTCGG
jgi:hypothetical protein